ncbi:polysaccharide deacetylase [Oscillospiraceae bacterium OttesenSCG-928-G22]|nr:polysaccharide deacetylase [Oscillospiraceae bacterium OttesenSCG-928-G22]
MKSVQAAISVHVTGDYFLRSLFGNLEERPKTLSNGEFGLKRGVDRVLDVADKYGLSFTFFVAAALCERYPDTIRRIAERGHEIANHGYEHENFANFSGPEQIELLKKSNDLLEKTTGKRPIGFRAPVGDMTAETLYALRDLGFAYSSSMYDDDDPYETELDGKKLGLMELPVKWTLYDLPYFLLCFNPAFPTGQSRVAPYTRVLENWMQEYVGAERIGAPFILQVDTQTIAKPGRIGLLEELIEFIQKCGTGEFMTLGEMADRAWDD